MAEATITADEDLGTLSRQSVLALCLRRSLELGREALTEQARRALRDGAPSLWHLRRFEGDELVSYGLASLQHASMELEVLGDVHDDSIFAAASTLSALHHAPLTLWTHGSTTMPEAPLPGYVRVRVLDRLERALPAGQPGPVPAGMTLRPFEIGRDEATFLLVNARSFAHHPDQGAMSLDDLRAREHESWFDPAGFLLAESSEGLLGFCWTKVHDEPWSSVGEIYVIGVDPSAAGLGLGRLLLRAGLAWMEERGLSRAMLYVEHDNAPAQHLYQAEGFNLAWHDARFEPGS